MTMVGRREKRERRIAGRVRRFIVAVGSLMGAEIGRILQIRGQSILSTFDLSTVRTIR